MQYSAKLTKEGRQTLIEFPDAPGCVTYANRESEIARLALEALTGWLEANLASGQVPPVPKSRRGLGVQVPALLALKVSLRQARAVAGLTQAALAKRMGVAQQQVARLEDPDSNPTIESLERAALALGAELRIELETKTVKTI
jgi:antitoxin HicB